MEDILNLIFNPQNHMYQLLVALFLGAFIGLRRELILQQEKRKGMIGLRTMPLLVLLGTISTYFSDIEFLPLIMFAGVIIFMSIAYFNGVVKLKRIGLTTEFTGLIMFLVGILVGNGEILLATVITVLVGIFNAYKEQMHDFAKSFSLREWTGALQLLIISLIILPILPEKAIDPWGVIIPFNIWFYVVLISALGFIGYFLNKYLGRHKSVYLTSILGSIVSSTAITTSLAMKSKIEKNIDKSFFVSTILLSTLIMEIRTLVLILILSHGFYWKFLAVLLSMLLMTVLFFFYVYLRNKNNWKNLDKIEIHPEIESPFEIIPALKFASFFTFFLLAIHFIKTYFSNYGVYAAAFIYSFIDTEVSIISFLESFDLGKFDFSMVWKVISMVIIINTLVKIVYVYIFGRRDVANKILFYIFLISAIGSMVFFLL